jgi:PAS domain S-box-containing protein
MPEVPSPDFRALFESAPGLYLVLTPDLRIVAVSNAYPRATMTKREEILGRSLFEVFPDNPDDPNADGVRKLKASLDRVLAYGQPDAMALQKYDIRRPESEGGEFEARYWSPVNSPILAGDGQVAYILHQVEDVTDFVRLQQRGEEQSAVTAELRLRADQMEAQAFLRSLELEQADRRRQQLETFIEHSPVGLAMFDRQMRYLSASRQWLEDRGIAGMDVVGICQYDLFPNLPEEWRDGHRRGLAGESVGGETDWVLPDGRRRTLRWQIQPWGDAGVETGGVIIFAEDITERKRTQYLLRSSEERLAAVIDTAMDAIITVNQEQVVVLFNDAAVKIFGCPASAAIGKPLDGFLPARFRDIHRRHVHRFGNTGETARSMNVPGTLFGRRANGEEFPIEATISQATLSGQQLYTVILRDITRRKEAEEMARLYEQTREVDRLKTEFFANVSHELRTPLTLILGPLRKMLTAPGISEAILRDLEVIERNALLLLRHVNDLLDLAKVDAGRMTPNYAEVDLAQLVRRVAANFESMAHDCRVGFQVDAPAAVPAELDAAQIERVLLNLLSNAFKFTPSGGHVRIGARQSSNWAVVEVEDTGPGIPDSLRETIFQRFRQLEGGGDRRFGGTGLGLSIVKQFVDLHGGTVTVEYGAAGLGSVFRVELPAEAPEGSTVHRGLEEPDEDMLRQSMAGFETVRSAVELPPAPEGAPSVLLVEDNPDMNYFLSRTLAATCRVYRAYDGREGVDQALAVHPDLILCDVMMPRMGGDQLVREIRSHAEFDDVPIILLTAKADDELRVSLLKEGAQDYLHKPFDTQAVLAKVERLLADRKRSRAAEEALHRLSGGLLQAQDRERQQVARELNEHIAQCMAALGIYLRAAQSSARSSGEGTSDSIEEGMAVLQQCIADVQKLSQTLHPLMLDNLGLRAAMEWHVQKFTAASGIPVRLEAPRGLGRLPADGDLTLFRVLQDALQRVRQSGAARADVRTYRVGEEAALEVTAKDAPGCCAEEDLDMAVTRERLRKLGGRLEITGSMMRAVLPAHDTNPLT